MTSYTSGILCNEDQSDTEAAPEGAVGAVDAPLESHATLLKRCGRPLTLPLDPPSSSSDDLTTATSIDPEDLLEAENVLGMPMPTSSQPK